MKQYELGIEILDKNYVDNLIISLVRQGYAVYLGEDNKVYFEIAEEDLREIK